MIDKVRVHDRVTGSVIAEGTMLGSDGQGWFVASYGAWQPLEIRAPGNPRDAGLVYYPEAGYSLEGVHVPMRQEPPLSTPEPLVHYAMSFLGDEPLCLTTRWSQTTVDPRFVTCPDCTRAMGSVGKVLDVLAGSFESFRRQMQQVSVEAAKLTDDAHWRRARSGS
jgi:hypothetical protein